MPADDPGSGLVLSLLYMLLTFRCPGFRLIAALMLVLSGLGQATADAESVPGKGSETDVGAAILLTATASTEAGHSPGRFIP